MGFLLSWGTPFCGPFPAPITSGTKAFPHICFFFTAFVSLPFLRVRLARSIESGRGSVFRCPPRSFFYLLGLFFSGQDVFPGSPCSPFFLGFFSPPSRASPWVVLSPFLVLFPLSAALRCPVVSFFFFFSFLGPRLGSGLFCGPPLFLSQKEVARPPGVAAPHPAPRSVKVPARRFQRGSDGPQ